MKDENDTNKEWTSVERRQNQDGTYETLVNGIIVPEEELEGNLETYLEPLKPPNPDKYNVVKINIQDMLNAEQEQDLFRWKGLKFCLVYFCAKILSIKVINENYEIIVSDDTAQIPCTYFKEIMERLTTPPEPPRIPEDSKENDITMATRMMFQSMKFLHKSIPKFEDLDYGNVVKIIGKLKHYRDRRVVIIKKIVNMSDSDLLQKQEECLSDFYNTKEMFNS